jgi:glucosamine--fructose-6-phosphate aminotransferase (isomerizing)
LTGEGPEITFAKTKSVTTCSGLLMQLALALAKPQDKAAANRLQLLYSTPTLLREVLAAVEPQIQALMPEIRAHKMVMAGGTVSNYGAALEFGIKLQEAANVPVMGNDTGNLLHGPWGPVNADWLIMLLVTSYDLELSKKTLQLAGALKGHRLVIADSGLELEDLCEYKIILPKPVDLLISGLTYLIPLQLLTYYWSLANGLNPDAPAEMRVMLDAMLPPGREEPELRSPSN